MTTTLSAPTNTDDFFPLLANSKFGSNSESRSLILNPKSFRYNRSCSSNRYFFRYGLDLSSKCWHQRLSFSGWFRFLTLMQIERTWHFPEICSLWCFFCALMICFMGHHRRILEIRLERSSWGPVFAFASCNFPLLRIALISAAWKYQWYSQSLSQHL